MGFRQGLWYLLIVTLIVISASLVVLAADVFAVLFLAILFGIFLVGLSQGLAGATPLPYPFALAAVVSLLLALAVVTVTVFGVRAAEHLQRVESRFQQGIERMQSFAKEQPIVESVLSTTPVTQRMMQAGDTRGAGDARQKSTEEGTSEQVQADASGSKGEGSTEQISSGLTSLVSSFAKTTFGFVVNTLIIFFVGLYLAANPQLYVRGVARLFPPARRSRVEEIFRREYEILWHWAMGRLMTMLITGLGTAVVLWLIGVPMPWMLGVVTGLLAFIPNIGPAIALVVALVFAFTESSRLALWVIPSYLGIQLVESYLITPLIQKKQTATAPAALLAVQAILGVVAGFLGVMIAAPLLAAVTTLIEEAYIKGYLERG